MKLGKRVALLAVLCALAPAQAARAQVLANYDYENLSFRGIGVDIGRIWPNKVDPTWMYGFRVDLGYLGPAIRLIPSVTYWKSDIKRAERQRLAESLSRLPALQAEGIVLDADDLGEIEWSTLSLGLDAHAVWTAPGRIFTWIGLGLAVHRMNGSGPSIDDTFIENLLDTMTPGVAAMAGLEFEPVPVLRIFAEGRYTLQSEVRYPGLRFGLNLMVPSATRPQ